MTFVTAKNFKSRYSDDIFATLGVNNRPQSTTTTTTLDPVTRADNRIYVQVFIKGAWSNIRTIWYNSSLSVNRGRKDSEAYELCYQGAVDVGYKEVDFWSRYHKFKDHKFRLWDSKNGLIKPKHRHVV